MGKETEYVVYRELAALELRPTRIDVFSDADSESHHDI